MKKRNLLDFEKLVNWLEGNLSPEEALEISQQAAQADEETQANIVWLHTIFDARKDLVIDSPPTEVRTFLRRRFEAYAETRRQPGFMQRLIGSLTFDSRLRPATASFRTVGTELAPRQLVYSTDLVDVTLNIQTRTDETLNVTGQIFLGNEIAPNAFVVQLIQGAREVAIVAADPLGEFVFQAIPTGAYELVVSSGQAEILIPSVEMTL